MLFQESAGEHEVDGRRKMCKKKMNKKRSMSLVKKGDEKERNEMRWSDKKSSGPYLYLD